MSNFHVGQKVVCVERRWANAVDCNVDPAMVPEKVPHYGEVVTVRKLEIYLGDVLIGLNEFGHLYHAEGFRPVVERKTDISVFTALLDTTKHPVPA